MGEDIIYLLEFSADDDAHAEIVDAGIVETYNEPGAGIPYKDKYDRILELLKQCYKILKVLETEITNLKQELKANQF